MSLIDEIMIDLIFKPVITLRPLHSIWISQELITVFIHVLQKPSITTKLMHVIAFLLYQIVSLYLLSTHHFQFYFFLVPN